MDEVKKELDEAIVHVIKEIDKMEPGCDAFSDASEDLTTLYKLRLEEMKIDNERAKIESEKKIEEEKQSTEAKSRMIDRCVNVGTTVFSVGVPIIAGAALTMKGYRFESTGVVGSPILKGLSQSIIHWFRPMK